MRHFIILTFCAVMGCTSAPVTDPQSFEDLLVITDTSETQICTLSLQAVKDNLGVEQLETAKAQAFDYDKIAAAYADDPAEQIRVIFRRAALKRRLNTQNDAVDLAQKFYAELSGSEGVPVTLKGFHDDFHYWVERISEQDSYGAPDSDAYNIRFCVMNEKRAALHAASRRDILARIEKGVDLPAPELIENINHESSFNDGFIPAMLSKIYTPEAAASLTPLERAQARGEQPIVPFDPKTADAFWKMRDAEIAAMLEYIESHAFSTPAEKLDSMTKIDQSLRRLWGGNHVEAHFETPEEYQTSSKGLGARVSDVDAFNTAELEKMLAGRGWFRDDVDGIGAGRHGWLIAQHADRNPEFQVKALKMIEAELGAPGVSKTNYAYLYDRVQMRWSDGKDMDKRLQRYGTQGRCSGPGTWEPFPVETPDRIDDIRAEVGLGTMAEYKSRFKDMCKTDER